MKNRSTSRILVYVVLAASFCVVLLSGLDLRAPLALYLMAHGTPLADLPAMPLRPVTLDGGAWFFLGSVVTAAIANYRAGRIADRLSFAYERRHGYYEIGRNDPYYNSRDAANEGVQK